MSLGLNAPQLSYKAKSGEWITKVDHVKNLEVTLSSNGNFKEHINNISSTANMRKTLPEMTIWKTGWITVASCGVQPRKVMYKLWNNYRDNIQ